MNPLHTKSRLSTLRVVKKIAAGSRGAKALTERFGEQLVCVRHRIDPTGTRRLTTVELLVSERAIARKPSPMVDIALRVQERHLQARLKAAGARWDNTEQTWRIRRATAIALGLKSRIVP